MSTNIIFIVAATLFFECRGEDLDTRRAVASVIKNVMFSPEGDYTGDKSRRFHPWVRFAHGANTHGTWMAVNKLVLQMVNESSVDLACWFECWSLADSVCSEDFKCEGSWTHFYSGVEVPVWARGYRFVRRGNLYFGKVP